MSIVFHISKVGTKCNDKQMPMCFFINIQALAIALAIINNTYSVTL